MKTTITNNIIMHNRFAMHSLVALRWILTTLVTSAVCANLLMAEEMTLLCSVTPNGGPSTRFSVPKAKALDVRNEWDPLSGHPFPTNYAKLLEIAKMQMAAQHSDHQISELAEFAIRANTVLVNGEHRRIYYVCFDFWTRRAIAGERPIPSNIRVVMLLDGTIAEESLSGVKGEGSVHRR